ncbi:MAG TPA: hypothetical protein VMW39_01115 [bacterium]|nr:hypothetical protein [bacterium]
MLTNREKLKSLIPVLARKHNFRPAIVEKDYYLNNIFLKFRTLLLLQEKKRI